MKLIRMGPNAHRLETPRGALLFSYEALVCVKMGPSHYVLDRVLTRVTREHIKNFIPHENQMWTIGDVKFAAVARNVLNAG